MHWCFYRINQPCHIKFVIQVNVCNMLGKLFLNNDWKPGNDRFMMNRHQQIQISNKSPIPIFLSTNSSQLFVHKNKKSLKKKPCPLSNLIFLLRCVCVFRVLSRLSWCFICIIIVQENSGFFFLLCYFSCARQFCLFLVVHLLWNERNEMNRLSRLIYCYYFLCFCFVRARERKTSVQWIKEKSVLLILCSIIPWETNGLQICIHIYIF